MDLLTKFKLVDEMVQAGKDWEYISQLFGDYGKDYYRLKYASYVSHPTPV